jgi:hypothetical protein
VQVILTSDVATLVAAAIESAEQPVQVGRAA